MKRCSNCFKEYDTQFDICPYCGYYEGQMPKELYHLHPGTALADRYKIGQVLGFGGFGITYKAWDTKLETVVAIKEYYPSGLVNRIPGESSVILFAGNKAAEYRFGLDRFLNEARNMAKFSSHKNIVNVYEYFEANNTAYIVMEFLDGVTLNEFLKSNSIDVPSSLELIHSICTALKEIHSHGIIHRDVSPDNIFLCYNGKVKLIDFGAARFSAAEEKQMTIILKPGFAPPEQYEKISAQGPWTDIYALGATLYMMITGKKPDESTNRKISDTLKPPAELISEIPENLSNTIMKAMALERHLRFDSIEEFEKALRGEKTILTLKNEKQKRKRKRLIGIAALVTVLVVMGGFLGWNIWQQKEAETLPAADIALYYELSGDEQQDAVKADALNAVIHSFTASFPGVTVQPVGIEKTRYLDTVQDALANGTAAICESTMLEDTQLETIACNLDSLLKSSLYSQNNTASSYFFDDYPVYFPTANRFPVSFYAPVIFINKGITDFSGSTVETLDDLTDYLGGSKGIAIHTSAVEAAKASFGSDVLENGYIAVVENMDGFAAREYAFYIAFVDQYDEVQQRLPARYALASFGSDQVHGQFADLYSISNNLSNDQKKVALAFLNYMLSESAQDYCYIRRWSGSLPLNRDALDEMVGVYNDFEGFFHNITDYTFTTG